MKSDTRYSNRRPSARSERPARDMRAQRTQKEQTVQLTVRGMARGAIRMEAEDGTIYTCAKENARGALFGDTVLAERIGRDRVVVAKVLTHAHENIMGVLRVHDGVRVIQPLERRLPAEIAVADLHAEAEDGEIVRTHVTRWEDEGGLCVSVEERIGSFEQATYALDALVMSMRLRTDFPEDVLKEADLSSLKTAMCASACISRTSGTTSGRERRWIAKRLRAARASICRGACCRCCRSSSATAFVRCGRTRINSR